MALIKADRVKETTATVGTGAFTLAGAVSTYRTFASVMSVNDTCYYTAINQATGEWETGQGCLTASTTLARGRIFAGSNGTSKVSFGSGIKEVFMSSQAAQLVADDSFNAANYTSLTSKFNLGIKSDQTASVDFGRNFANITTGTGNVAIGWGACKEFTTGLFCIAIGYAALENTRHASNTVAIGANAAYTVGDQTLNAGYKNDHNIVIGALAGAGMYSLEKSVLIGSGAAVESIDGTATNAIVIGYQTAGKGSNTTTIGNDDTTECHLYGHVIPTGAFKPASLADSAAPSNAIYYSTTQNKLVYKDSGGAVNNLY